MKLLLDECLPGSIIRALMENHDCLIAADSLPGALDSQLIACAESEGRIIITEDRGIGGQVLRHARSHPGIVVISPGTGSAADKLTRLRMVLAEGHQAVAGQITVIDASGVRRRPVP
jgi:predicted nuclease of predicted toxin-antitoxin system